MSEGQRILELDENLEFQRREWQVQRIAGGVLTVFVAAAGLGLFGSGPLSHAQAGTASAPIWVQYERFVRTGTSFRMRVQCQSPERSPHNEALLRISRAYFDSIRIDRLTPEPISIDLEPDVAILRFAAPLDEAGPASYVFDVSPVRAGIQSVELRSGSASIHFVQLAYF